MGVESGGWGNASSAVEKSAGDVPPEIMIFQYLFSWHICKFCIFSTFFKIKWPKSDDDDDDLGFRAPQQGSYMAPITEIRGVSEWPKSEE